MRYTSLKYSTTMVLRHLLPLLALVVILPFYAQSQQPENPAYIPGKIVFKIGSETEFDHINEEFRSKGPPDTRISAFIALTEVEEMLKTFGLESMDRVMAPSGYSELQAERMQRARPGSAVLHELSDDLTRTFMVRYSIDVDPVFVASKVRQVPGVIYAEPHYIMEVQHTPNDPLFGQSGQHYFEYLRFTRAWDVTRSSRDIVIAIVDTGVDYNHPDLSENLWRNPDPGRARQIFPGMFSAVVNDTIGWNFWESGPASNPVQNGDPMGTFSNHGTHVAGTAAAVTDNGIGVASAGFNSSYMAVRVGGTQDNPLSIGFGYQGILYAAINGAHVINCSFGSGARSEFGRDIVNLATELGSVVIGAAGNDNNDQLFYPASYENVLSVASVLTNTGVKSSFSNYGYNIDVAATGTNILSTVFNNQYGFSSGTSMAAPVAAGLAALVRHQFPDWLPERIIGQIRGTADGALYAANPNFTDKLGGGLLNALKAVTVPVPYLRITDVRFVDAMNDKLGVNEAGFIELTMMNYGAATQNLTYEIINLNQTANLTTTAGSLGGIPEGSEVMVRIPVEISDRALDGVIPQFRIRFRDPVTEYVDFRFIEYGNHFVDTHNANMVLASFTSLGAVGFNRSPDGDSGEGFIPLREINGQRFEWGNALFESGVMIEVNHDETVYMITNVREREYPPQHFHPRELYTIRSDAQGNQTGFALMTTELRSDLPDMDVEMRTFAFADPDLSNSVLVYYTIKNIDQSRLAFNDTYVGMYADWDIGDYSNNSVFYVESDSILVAKANQGTHPYVTVAHLGGISSAFAINNAYTGPVDSLNFGVYYSQTNTSYNGFPNLYKSWSMKAGTRKTEVNNTDISMVTASGPFTVRFGQSINVGFVYTFGETVEELVEQVRAARAKNVMPATPNFNSPRVPVYIPEETSLVGNYPNPFNPTTNIIVDLERTGDIVLELYDIMGRRITGIFEGRLRNRRYEIPFDASGLASGIYVVVLRSDQGIQSTKITLVR